MNILIMEDNWNNKTNRQIIREYIEKNSVNWYNNDKQDTAVKS